MDAAGQRRRLGTERVGTGTGGGDPPWGSGEGRVRSAGIRASARLELMRLSRRYLDPVILEEGKSG